MDVLHDRCAGLDVHKDTVVACVRIAEGRKARREVRTFGTTTAELLKLADWLSSEKVTHVLMEATGVYWKPVWHGACQDHRVRGGHGSAKADPAQPLTSQSKREQSQIVENDGATQKKQPVLARQRQNWLASPEGPLLAHARSGRSLRAGHGSARPRRLEPLTCQVQTQHFGSAKSRARPRRNSQFWRDSDRTGWPAPKARFLRMQEAGVR